MVLKEITKTNCGPVCSSHKEGKRGFSILYDATTCEVKKYTCFLGEDCVTPEIYSMTVKGETARDIVKRITNEKGS